MPLVTEYIPALSGSSVRDGILMPKSKFNEPGAMKCCYNIALESDNKPGS